MKTSKRVYRVDRRRISMIKFIFEAYEGLAMVTTLDSEAGVIALFIAPGCEKMAESVISDLSRNFLIEPVLSTASILPKVIA